MVPKSKSLTDEPPLLLLPSLAVTYGLEVAVVIQQVHYWLSINEEKELHKPLPDRQHWREKRWWAYNSYADWQRQFPFWSLQKTGRVFRAAEERLVLISRQFEVSEYKRRKWYSLDYTLIGKARDAK